MPLYELWKSPRFARFAKAWSGKVAYYVPPLVLDGIRYLASDWEYAPEGWSKKDSEIKGWNVPSAADAQEKHWSVLMANVQGPGPLGVAHFPWSTTRVNRADHNTMMSFGYVLALAARKKDRLRILDWGGGVGHYSVYSKALLPEMEIEYHCYDVPYLCELGRKLIPDAHFHTAEADLCEQRFDLVISSSSLHYFEDWRKVFRQLTDAAGDYLYIARLQMVSREPSFVVVQRPYHAGYDTQYLSWFLNRQEVVECAVESGMELVREFVFAEEWRVKGAPEQGESRGFLLRRRTT